MSYNYEPTERGVSAQLQGIDAKVSDEEIITGFDESVAKSGATILVSGVVTKKGFTPAYSSGRHTTHGHILKESHKELCFVVSSPHREVREDCSTCGETNPDVSFTYEVQRLSPTSAVALFSAFNPINPGIVKIRDADYIRDEFSSSLPQYQVNVMPIGDGFKEGKRILKGVSIVIGDYANALPSKFRGEFYLNLALQDCRADLTKVFVPMDDEALGPVELAVKALGYDVHESWYYPFVPQGDSTLTHFGDGAFIAAHNSPEVKCDPNSKGLGYVSVQMVIPRGISPAPALYSLVESLGPSRISGSYHTLHSDGNADTFDRSDLMSGLERELSRRARAVEGHSIYDPLSVVSGCAFKVFEK